MITPESVEESHESANQAISHYKKCRAASMMSAGKAAVAGHRADEATKAYFKLSDAYLDQEAIATALANEAAK